jgi:hypothetical protein
MLWGAQIGRNAKFLLTLHSSNAERATGLNSIILIRIKYSSSTFFCFIQEPNSGDQSEETKEDNSQYSLPIKKIKGNTSKE